MSTAENCVFCKIVSGEIPGAKVYEDATAIAFLDIAPLAPGHLLLIPRDHYNQLVDIPTDVCAKYLERLPQLGASALQTTGATGFNILCNNGEHAGQVVSHVHFHIIPRRVKDSLGYRWNAGSYGEGELEALQKAYRTTLSAS